MEYRLRPLGFMEFFCKTAIIGQLRKSKKILHELNICI